MSWCISGLGWSVGGGTSNGHAYSSLLNLVRTEKFENRGPLGWGLVLVESGYIHSLKCCLKKNQNAPRPSEHPPIMWEKFVLCQVDSEAAQYKSSTQWGHGLLRFITSAAVENNKI